MISVDFELNSKLTLIIENNTNERISREGTKLAGGFQPRHCERRAFA